MSKLRKIFLLPALIFTSALSSCTTLESSQQIFIPQPSPTKRHFLVTSNDFVSGKDLALEQAFASKEMGCPSGGNRSPSIYWTGAPKETKSFAITVFDPDAPTGSGWWHWIVTNIPGTVHSLPKGAGSAEGASLPPGAIHIANDFGQSEYGGPCPPPGPKHNYHFTVWALKVEKLDISPTSSSAEVRYKIRSNALASGTLVGRYGQ